MPVQKQTRAGQRTRFKVRFCCNDHISSVLSSCLVAGQDAALVWSVIFIIFFFCPIQAFVAIGDYNGHVGLGVKCSKEVATAIRGAIILAKLSIVPVRRGYWGNKIGKPHTVPCKVTGRCGSVLVRLIPAPRGTGIVSAPVPKKLLMMAGIDDCYTSARGCTATLGNFGKIAVLEFICSGFSPCSAQLHLSSGVVVVIRRQRIAYCNARQEDLCSVVPSVPFFCALHFFIKNECSVNFVLRTPPPTYFLLLHQQRQHLTPSPRPTATWPLTCGRRRSSPSLPTRYRRLPRLRYWTLT